MTKTNWHKRFYDLALHIASWSKDRSTKVGAVIVDCDKRILATGYNGFPSGCDDTKEERHQRPAKYMYTEHGERNAIYNAVKSGVRLQGATLYCTMFPCADCTRAIIQSGIKTIITPVPNMELAAWKEHFPA